MAEILGIDVARLIGRHFFDFLYPEDVPAAQKLFEAKMRGDLAPFHFKVLQHLFAC